MTTRALALLLLIGGCESCGGEPAARGWPVQPLSSAGSASPHAAPAPPAGPAPCELVEEGFGPDGAARIEVEVVAKGLDVPWGIAFLKDGAMLVTERPGRLVVVARGGEVSAPIAEPSVSRSGEAGLLGIALHPSFEKNRQLYLYLSDDDPEENRVERWVLAPDRRSARLDRVVVSGIPSAVYHDGGRIRFGPDGMLYVGTGDGREPARAQDPDSLAGKILRLTPDGSIPDDNPLPGKAAFIGGIRNTQGFDWFDEQTLAVTDHGPSGELHGWSGHDEVNVARAGQNLGWPEVHGCDPHAGTIVPSLTWRDAVPPGGAAFYTGSAIPEWKGALLIGTLRSEHLHVVHFDPKDRRRVQKHAVYLSGPRGFGRLRDVVMGPDGHPYVTTSNCDGRGRCGADRDRILRIVGAR